MQSRFRPLTEASSPRTNHMPQNHVLFEQLQQLKSRSQAVNVFNCPFNFVCVSVDECVCVCMCEHQKISQEKMLHDEGDDNDHEVNNNCFRLQPLIGHTAGQQLGPLITVIIIPKDYSA